MWRLMVSYGLDFYDQATTDGLVLGVLGEDALGGLGAGFGVRDLEFYYPTEEAAERAREKLGAAGLPLAFEVQIENMEEDTDGESIA